MNDTVKRLEAEPYDLGMRDEFDGWLPIESAPPGDQVVYGVCSTNRVMPMIRGGLQPQDDGTASFAKTMFGSADDIWWARYPDGKVGSFLPTHWRPKKAAER